MEQNKRRHIGRLRRLLDDPLIRIEASSLTKIGNLGAGFHAHALSMNMWYSDSTSLQSGEGGFAYVELCSLNQGGVKKNVAVKRFHESILADDTCLKLLCQEIEVMAKNRHKYMVQMIGIGAEDPSSIESIRQSLFIVQDSCNGGNLKRLIMEQSIEWGAQGLTATDSLSWCIQLASALSFLHSQSPPIIHRDIKLENILLATPLKSRRKGQTVEIRLIDFGLACPLYADSNPPPESSAMQTDGLSKTTRLRSALMSISRVLSLRRNSSVSRSTNKQLQILHPSRTMNRIVCDLEEGEGEGEGERCGGESEIKNPELIRIGSRRVTTFISPASPTAPDSPTRDAPGSLMGQFREGIEDLGFSHSKTLIRAGSRRNHLSPNLSFGAPRSPRGAPAVMGMVHLSTTYEDGPDASPSGEAAGEGSSHLTVGPTEVLLELTGQTGSLLYMSPEVYNQEPYNEKADVFSFALVMYELLHRRTLMHHVFDLNPKAGDDEASVDCIVAKYAESVANKWGPYRPPIDSNMPSCLSDLIVKCWSHKASDRPSMAEVHLKLEGILKEEDLSCLNSRPGGDGCFCI